MSRVELVPFIPESASYQIWHPKDFLVNEDEDGILTITSPETNSNLTLSSYNATQHVSETMLLDFFQDATKNYTPSSEVKSTITESRIWFEGEFRRDNIFWIWWALSHSNTIILASANSENMLSDEDRHLYIFMLHKMQIYPSETED